MAQMKSVGKNNEQTSVLEILDLLNIEGAIITVDAMNTQKKIVGLVKVMVLKMLRLFAVFV